MNLVISFIIFIIFTYFVNKIVNLFIDKLKKIVDNKNLKIKEKDLEKKDLEEKNSKE